VQLFKIKGAPYRVNLLTVNASDDWLESAELVDLLEADATEANTNGGKDKSAKRRAYIAALQDAVFGYNPPGKFEGDPGDVTMAELLDAYQILKAVSDPFVHSERRGMEAMTRKMELLPKEILGKVFASQNPPG